MRILKLPSAASGSNKSTKTISSESQIKVTNTFINKFNPQLSQQTEPLALYHTKTFETSKYSRVEVQFIRGESSLIQI